MTFYMCIHMLRYISKETDADTGYRTWEMLPALSSSMPKSDATAGSKAESAAKAILALVTLTAETALRNETNQIVYFNGMKWDIVSREFLCFLCYALGLYKVSLKNSCHASLSDFVKAFKAHAQRFGTRPDAIGKQAHPFCFKQGELLGSCRYSYSCWRGLMWKE